MKDGGGFATSITRGHGALPSVLGKPEEEYYKIYSKPPGHPPKGQVLLQRVPHTRMLKITTSDGESHRFLYDSNVFLRLKSFGILPEKAEKIVDYVWNFHYAYVMVQSSVRSSAFKI